LPKVSENMFYVAAFGRAEDEYRFSESGKVISKTDFPSLKIQPSFEKYQFCLRAKVNSNLNSTLIELVPTNCNKTSAVICRQKIYNPPLCNNSSNSSSNNNVLANDPLRLMMDSMMVSQKEMLVKAEKDKFIEMFDRLNKTSAFESFVRYNYCRVCLIGDAQYGDLKCVNV
jgi:hypothetical protein